MNILTKKTNHNLTVVLITICTVLLNSCAIDRCEGSAFFERAIRIIFLDGVQDVRINEPIRLSINGNFVEIAEDGIVDLEEWQETDTNNPETINLQNTFFLNYQLDFLEVNNTDTVIAQTDMINLEYTVNDFCQYLDIETMIVRHNDEVIFHGGESGAFSHRIRR